MANQSIILASNVLQRPIAPLEQTSYALVRQKCRDLATQSAKATDDSASPANLPHLDLHFIYTPTCKNGKLAAKRALQVSDDYWSHMIDHVG